MSIAAAAAFAAAAFLFGLCSAHADTVRNPVRRFQVALQILAGDAHTLAQSRLSANRRRGLSARIANSLSTLRYLARQYLQAKKQNLPRLLKSVDALRREFAAGHIGRLADASAKLAKRYPLGLRGLRRADARPVEIRAGRHIYRTLCMGCHEHPESSSDNPAPNLFAMARRLPQREFIARLLGGVHGTPAVALHNPFTDAQIAGLAAFLSRSTSDSVPTRSHTHR